MVNIYKRCVKCLADQLWILLRTFDFCVQVKGNVVTMLPS